MQTIEFDGPAIVCRKCEESSFKKNGDEIVCSICGEVLGRILPKKEKLDFIKTIVGFFGKNRGGEESCSSAF